MASRLLIADDSSTILRVFERTFSPDEFILTFANNGEEAAAVARKIKPDLVIADINMPGKNGFEVCEEIRKDPMLKDTPVLLLVGILDDFDEDASKRVGADGFIVKPFEANAAIERVRDALTRGRTGMGETTRATEEEGDDILELDQVIEEVPREAGAAPEPGDEFVLDTPLREVEVEVEEALTTTDALEEEPLSLDLPVDEGEVGRGVRDEQGTSLFGELWSETEQAGIKGEFEREGKEEFKDSELEPLLDRGAAAKKDGLEIEVEEEFRSEQLETLLTESASELERIEGLELGEEETPEVEKGPLLEVEAPAAGEETVEEELATLRETEEPEEVIEKLRGPELASVVPHSLEDSLKRSLEGMAKQMAASLAGEIRQPIEDMVRDIVPDIVRREVEKSRKG